MVARLIILLCVLMSTFSLCPPSTPPVVISETDCAKADLIIQAGATVTGTAGRWVVAVKGTVTCKGIPVNGAEIKVKYPWAGAYKTTSRGGIVSTQRVSSVNPGPPTGTVVLTIRGFDGARSFNVGY